MYKRNEALLLEIASVLEDQVKHIVYHGAATLPLYQTDPSAFKVRSHELIELVIAEHRFQTRSFWTELLSQKGFEAHPRLAQYWKFGGKSVQVSFLSSFQRASLHRWYEDGLFHAQTRLLENQKPIRILPPVYYLAILLDRILEDLDMDWRYLDAFEDFIYLLDGRRELGTEIQQSYYEVREFVVHSLVTLLQREELEESIAWILPLAAGAKGVQKLIDKIEKLAHKQTAIFA